METMDCLTTTSIGTMITVKARRMVTTGIVCQALMGGPNRVVALVYLYRLGLKVEVLEVDDD